MKTKICYETHTSCHGSTCNHEKQPAESEVVLFISQGAQLPKGKLDTYWRLTDAMFSTILETCEPAETAIAASTMPASASKAVTQLKAAHAASESEAER